MTLNLSEKKYILWDMDGVLINSEPAHYRAWIRVMDDLFGIKDFSWNVYKTVIGKTYGEHRDIVRHFYNVDIDTKEVRDYYEVVRLEMEKNEGFFPMPGVVETMKDLREKGYTMAVASSSWQGYIERCMKGIGTEPYLSLLFSGDRVAHSKPAPDTFLEAAKLLGAKPEECIVVEDSTYGTMAAKAADMFLIGLRNPGSGDQDLSRADVVIESLPELMQLLKGPGKN